MSETSLRCVDNVLPFNLMNPFNTSTLVQATVELGLVPLLRALMDAPAREIQKEACWTLSNVAAGTAAQVRPN
jgi:hypothetical protein